MLSNAVFAVRFHGRGGQGVVTAAETLSVAAFLDGRHSQAFPSFGSERMGAPVVSYCRISDEPIRRHDPLATVDAVVIQDPTLVHQVDLLSGLATDGLVLVNTARTPHLGGGDGLAGANVVTLAATDIARRTVGRPTPNTALLGGLVALTGVVGQGSLHAAVRRRFAGPLGEANVAAAAEAASLLRPQALGAFGA